MFTKIFRIGELLTQCKDNAKRGQHNGIEDANLIVNRRNAKVSANFTKISKTAIL